MKLNQLKIFEAKKLLENKEISAKELAEACINSAKQSENKIHALMTICEEECIAQAKIVDEKRAKNEKLGALAGIPGIIKDCISTKGIISTASSKMLENYRPVFDAHVVEELKKEDFVLFGKANMDEFAMGSSTENSAYYTTSNPWDITTAPGGSSGGSTASIAADEALFALGSDTGGSIRQPAAFCGVVGVKPTYGTVSRYGLISFASSLDQIGAVAKDVKDAALISNIIARPDKRDSTYARVAHEDYLEGIEKDIKGLKIGVPKECFAHEIDADVKKAFDKCLKCFEDMGAVIKEVSLSTFDYALSAYYIISSAEVASNLARFDGIRYGHRAQDYTDLKDMYKKTRSEGFGDEVKRRVLLGNYVLSSGYYDAYYLKAIKVRNLISKEFKKLFEECDILFSPTTPTPAFKIGSKATPIDMYLSDLFTVPVNIAGVAAMNLPVSISENGLPVGVQIIADAFCEKKMFNCAYNLEQAVGFCGKPSFKEGK